VPRPALELADIFRAHGPAWRQANAGHASLTQLKVMSAIRGLCLRAVLQDRLTVEAEGAIRLKVRAWTVTSTVE
jgi:hypothetical protein